LKEMWGCSHKVLQENLAFMNYHEMPLQDKRQLVIARVDLKGLARDVSPKYVSTEIITKVMDYWHQCFDEILKEYKLLDIVMQTIQRAWSPLQRQSLGSRGKNSN